MIMFRGVIFHLKVLDPPITSPCPVLERHLNGLHHLLASQQLDFDDIFLGLQSCLYLKQREYISHAQARIISFGPTFNNLAIRKNTAERVSIVPTKTCRLVHPPLL